MRVRARSCRSILYRSRCGVSHRRQWALAGAGSADGQLTVSPRRQLAGEVTVSSSSAEQSQPALTMMFDFVVSNSGYRSKNPVYTLCACKCYQHQLFATLSHNIQCTLLLQHPLQILAQHLLNPRNPPLRLPLHALIIILPELTNKRKHLRQQRQPLLAQPLGKTLLAQHGRKPRVRILGPHVPQQHGVHFAVVGAASTGGRELGDGGDDGLGYGGSGGGG